MSAPFSPRLRDIGASEFPHLEAHWNATPAERLRERAEIEHFNALSHSMMDAGMAPLNAKQAERWADADDAKETLATIRHQNSTDDEPTLGRVRLSDAEFDYAAAIGAL